MNFQTEQGGGHLKILPQHIIDTLQTSSGKPYLRTVAAALREHTDAAFPQYQDLLADAFAQWRETSSGPALSFEEDIFSFAAIARLVPVARHLTASACDFLLGSGISILLAGHGIGIEKVEVTALSELLLAIFRLLSFDRRKFRDLVPPVFLSSLFGHAHLPIRYLAILCMCQVIGFADATEQNLVARYVNEQEILGQWEGEQINYRLLKLYEERRWLSLNYRLTPPLETANTRQELKFTDEDLDVSVASFEGILLPRYGLNKESSTRFVKTSNARRNLHNMGRALQESTSVLVLGPGGSGKSFLITEAARLLGHRNSMITLHLNDQTDAKSLLGFYTSSADGKGFVWQPGVLTKAVQEGRWVLIEDTNRVPGEVASILQPLTENNELFIPSRKERLRPHDNFRLFGTVTTLDGTFKAGTVTKSLFDSHRHWHKVTLAEPTEDEVVEILTNHYSALEGLLPQMWKAHAAILDCYKSDVRFRDMQNRLPTLRDLRKWCSRLSSRSESFAGQSLKNNFSETFWIHLLKDGFDLYASHLPSTTLSSIIISALGQHLNIAPDVAVHVLEKAVVVLREDEASVQIGRTRLEKMVRGQKSRTSPTQFANTRQARATMEAVSASIASIEPLLLVGETGIGKTTIVQQIADSLGQELTVVNLSQQSETTDLLGGLKPITTRSLLVPLMDRFNGLFEDTFNVAKNESFRSSVNKALMKQKWSRLLVCWDQAVNMAKSTFERASPARAVDDQQSTKRRKLDTPRLVQLRKRWDKFASELETIKAQIQRSETNQLFAFVESRLVQAVRKGEWLLLDEINLASAEALDNVLTLLQTDHTESGRPFLLLAEAGNVEKIHAHPNFRLFAAMNPATDTGKKDLPPAIRSQFTELYTHSGDTDLSDLNLIIETYLGSSLNNDKTAANDLAKSYLALKTESRLGKFVDGAGDVPHYSLRSLTRCLQYAKKHADSYGLRRSMYEGLQMSFFTVLDSSSRRAAQHIVERQLFAGVRNVPAMLSKPPKQPANVSDFVAFGQQYVLRGPLQQEDQTSYIKTASVERNLAHLARAASMRRFPILLQGPTSAGKTSMVEYLARYTGNHFVRINNHEHTDLQEYLGTYMSGANGQLIYAEGVLVEALRKGYWIVLDELNLAPSDVLEALNRLLDDNRELLVPESQEIVRPHPNFMLFATQNPAGLYGGRKRLSRAFRNRFLEIHVDDIPEDELEIILGRRAQIPESFCRQIVQVYKSLSLQRQSARLFEQQNSFATLRDLFRWASRPIFDRQELANHGFMLLGERVRNAYERSVVKSTIEDTLKVQIDETNLYGTTSLPDVVKANSNVIWTPAMRRLFVLVSSAISNNEPVLLVGETGCGKTQICQTIAEAMNQTLDIYNAHSNTESSDLIGSQRPIRHKSEIARSLHADIEALSTEFKGDTLEDLITQFKAMDTSGFEAGTVRRIRGGIIAYQSLFAWNNGSLVRAMLTGNHFLLDEISLADDSVLERLNSVLEPSRTILLAEKGAKDNVVVADPKFQFLATMNPGGDYGKRELSAALRNRLTEIWVPPLSDDDDIMPILEHRLGTQLSKFAKPMLEFAKFFQYELQDSSPATVSLRSLLAWASFISANSTLDVEAALFHGCALVYIDALGANPAGMLMQGPIKVDSARALCVQKLSQISGVDFATLTSKPLTLEVATNRLTVGDFALLRTAAKSDLRDFTLEIPTTLKNAMRLLRAMHTDRPILLEGNPGVGKTALVSSLAQTCGRSLARINLSDQTDLMDLFGSDTPAEGQAVGTFVWQDGPLLKAMQQGQWVLLDEMNLASQSVLEGLNACLDHRKEVYISELDKTFTCDPSFKLFATQNPHHQGGGRKGLPASFVNRFTVVYADPLDAADLVQICQVQNPNIEQSQLQTLVTVISQCQNLINNSAKFADGGPWELNLRDTSRWLDLMRLYPTLESSAHFDTVVAQRFRSVEARRQATKLAEIEFGSVNAGSLYTNLSPTHLQIGTSFLPRDRLLCDSFSNTSIPTEYLHIARSINTAISQEWPVILSGPSGSGKTTLIRTIAQLSGAKLVEFAVSADTDIADFVGGFEQHDMVRDLRRLTGKAREMLSRSVVRQSSNISQAGVSDLLHALHVIDTCDEPDITTLRNALGCAASVLPEAATLLESLDSVTDGTAADSSARFVWNDGILIDALQEGSWLVLDNANLCNPSVLDRLNSLLEPNGALVVNEQHSASEGSRKVTPHANFRIFLLTDPANGELSRAMRNRSLEIYLNDRVESFGNTRLPAYPASSQLARLRPLFHNKGALNRSSWTEVEPWVSQLSVADTISLENVIAQQPEVIGKARAQISSAPPSQALLPLTEDATEKHDSLPIRLLLNEPLVTLNMPPFRAETFECQSRIQFLSTILWSCSNQLERIRDIETNTSASRSVLQKSYHASNYEGRASVNQLPPVYAFTQRFLSILIESLNWQDTRDMLLIATDGYTTLVSQVVHFISDMIVIFQNAELDNSRLQAYMMLGTKILRSSKRGTIAKVATMLLQAIEDFYTPLQLKSGKHMQHMWHFWRPHTARSQAQFDVQTRLEDVLTQFDKLCRSSPRKLPEHAALRLELVNLGSSAIESGDTQFQMAVLDRAMDDLGHGRNNSPGHSPLFESSFSAIRATVALHQSEINAHDQQLLQLLGRPSGTSTQAVFSLHSPAQLLNRVGVVSEELTDGARDIEQGQVLDLIEVAAQVGSVMDQPICCIDSVAEQSAILTKFLSSQAHSLTISILPAVQDLTKELLELLITSVTGPDPYDLMPSLEQANIGHGLLHGLEDTTKYKFRLAGDRVAQNTLMSQGESLLLIAEIAIKLFVPDKVYDPAVYPALVRERHQRRACEIQERITAYRNYQILTTGQNTSAVVRLLETDLFDLGEAPEDTAVYRPSQSHLLSVQAEFSNILRTIIEPDIITKLLDSDRLTRDRHAAMLASRVQTATKRLQSTNRAYRDVVGPVLGFLNVMLLGTELVIDTEEANQGSAPSKWSFLFDRSGKQVVDEFQNAADVKVDLARLTELTLRATAPIDDEAVDPVAVNEFVHVADRQFMVWKQHLTTDQAKAAEDSKYYTYREVEDDAVDEAELSTLFPQFNEESQKDDTDKHSYNCRSAAIQMTRLHRALFEHPEPQVLLSSFLKSTVKPAYDRKSALQDCMADAMAPVLLALEDTTSCLNDLSRKNINVYNDSHIGEVRELLGHVSQCQTRFQHIAAAWPEHAVPVQVLEYCQQTLRMSLKDPIAKLLTRVEKLLDLVSQWQSVASREFSAQQIVESLTSLIISWRRLELSSWSRLLDGEATKHRENTDSWYFIAYEAIIHNSIAIIQQDGDVPQYCLELARTLEQFFTNASTGSFAPRLKLLRTFEATLQSLEADEQRLQPIRECVRNVIDHYSRYAEQIKKSLSTDRAVLEKDITEQIKLASWKDTNVTALRESARRTHYKLFKIVRKYRALLDKPVANLKASNKSPQSIPSITPSVAVSLPLESQLENYLKIWSQRANDWQARPARLRDLKGAATSIERLLTSSSSAFAPETEIAAYLSELSESASELRKETPNILNDDNGALVRDLKNRKRRLLADTMKDLSFMGVRRNLGTTELSAQSSSATVLAFSWTVPVAQTNATIEIAERAFHELLDNMPNARAALTDHSDELTDGDVRRGVGLLEGLLSHILQERKALHSSYDMAASLRQTCLALSNMQGQPLDNFAPEMSTDKSQHDEFFRRMSWLSELLKLYAHVADLQAKHGNLQIAEMVIQMYDYATQLQNCCAETQGLISTIEGIVIRRQSETIKECKDLLVRLRCDLEWWARLEPNIEHITRQITPWVSFSAESTTAANGVHITSLSKLDAAITNLLNSIFVAVQDVSAVQKQLPSSSEDLNWLISSVTGYNKMLHAFKVSQVTFMINSIISDLVHVEKQDFNVAISMLLAASAIVNQYYVMYTSTQNKLEQVYLETCRFAVYLATVFSTLAKEGFCTPAESADGEEQSGKLESGTGLGEGEAADDISKDVGDDEDLTELAQEAGERADTEKMDKSQDAVDMGMDDLEGEMGSGDEAVDDHEQSGNESADEEEQQMDEESGSVDDLDPTAVDEKMWDDMQKDSKEQEKEMKSEKAQGKNSEDNAARDGNQNQEELEGDIEAGMEQEDDVNDEEGQERADGENIDPHLDQQDALELPDDIQIDGKDAETDPDSDMDMDGLSDVEDSNNKPEDMEDGDINNEKQQDTKDADNAEESEDDEFVTQNELDDDLDMGDEDEDNDLGMQKDETSHDVDQQQEAETGVANGLQADEDDMRTDENAPSGVSDAQQATEQSKPQDAQESSTEDAKGTANGQEQQGEGQDDNQRRNPTDAFQRLADVIKQYHRRREILTASEDRQKTELDADLDIAEAEFEHATGDDQETEMQALGSSEKHQAQDLSQGQAIEDENPDTMEDLPMPDQSESDQKVEETLAEKYARINAAREAKEQEQRTGLAEGSLNPPRVVDTMEDALEQGDEMDDDDNHQEDKQRIPAAPTSELNSREEAHNLWSLASSRTQALSLMLTEQLRLILQPTTATKLRGDYRTGKRLNIRRIIPYIASGYKKDKIWMRRSVPSKRNYQVMLAVDDSKSMAESGADVLAMETLCLVSRALSGLEVGELSILAFGQQYSDVNSAVKVAHPFATPFVPSHSGPQVFRHFSFQQRATNIQALLHESIALFKDARLKSSAREASDLWQLQLIISDGHIGSDHDIVRRLVRKAREEKIMCVFVVVDAGQESILDLKEVYFETVKNGRGGEEVVPKTKRYLEGFPFQYYVVVKEVGDLPGVLCTVLRGWFESVVEGSR